MSATWLLDLEKRLRSAQIRAAVVLIGDAQFQQNLLESFIENAAYQQGIWCGLNSIIPQAKAIESRKAAHQLGQETDFAIFRAEEGFDPNAIAIFTGMIKAGGIAFFCFPNSHLQTNPACQKYLSYPQTLNDSLKLFTPFLYNQLAEKAFVIRQNHPLPELPELKPAPNIELPTGEQTLGIKKILSVGFGHRNRPLLITADRGRGKSYLLGLAAIELIKQGKHHITLTAARKDQVKTALDIIERHQLSQQIQFKAPDDLIDKEFETEVLLIDEAAHLPLSMLEKLVQKYKRTVFATTQHGYEGSGRGFQLKFQARLDELVPNWKQHQLAQPIRWQNHDLLEQTIEKALLLSPPAPLAKPTEPQTVQIEAISAQQLIKQPKLLESLFYLLVQAHYQTTPNDLMQLLESPDLVIFIAKNPQNQLLAGLLAIKEGNLPQPEINQRFQGHLFCQQFYQQHYRKEILNQSGFRVMRIAVADNFQQQGIGSQLLKSFINQVSADIDYVATSFGVTSELFHFWQKNQFQFCGLGLKKDKASGSHSALLMHSISAENKALMQHILPSFREQFLHNLTLEFKALDAQLIKLFLANLNYNKQPFPRNYIQGQKFEHCSLALRHWLAGSTDFLNRISLADQTLIIQKLLQNLPWQHFYSAKCNNRKKLENYVKKLISIN